MKSPLHSRHKTSRDADSIGLVATGSAGTWDIDVDETISGAERWFLQIDNGEFYLYCELKDRCVVKDVSAYLKEPPTARLERKTPTAPVVIGALDDGSVEIMRDEEHGDRFFLTVAGRKGASFISFAISGQSLIDLTNAIEQVESDLFQ